MTEGKMAPRPSPSVWETQVLRLTAFPGPGFTAGDPSWWADLVGQPPESRLAQPRKGLYSTEGPFENGKLSLTIQFNRIDWLLTAAEQPATEAAALSTLGAFPDSLDGFLKLMLRWLEAESAPELLRLAFGAVLLQLVENREEGYRRIATYLPSVGLDPEGSSDFLYRINRPRTSAEVAGLRVNRLSTWWVGLLRSRMLAIEPSSQSAVLLPGTDNYACRLELDINTAPGLDIKTAPGLEHKLPRNQLSRLLQELVDVAKEIAEVGDIP
jgi:hypothetical protein